jgi:hypothetical protein
MASVVIEERKVRFADSNNTLLYDQNADKEVVWVAPELCNRNKELAFRDGRRFARQGGVDNLLEKTFLEPSREVQINLNAFVNLGDDEHTPRGIERHVSVQHGDERRFKRCQCVENVVDMHVYLRRKGATYEEIEKELAELSLEHSVAATKFARRLARADQLAARGNLDVASTDSSASSATDDSSVASKQSKTSLLNFSSKTKNRTLRLTKIITGHGYGSKR